MDLPEGGKSVSPCLNLMDMTTDPPTVRTTITEEEKTNLENGLYTSVLYADLSSGSVRFYSMYFPETAVFVGGALSFSTFNLSVDDATESATISSSSSYSLMIGEKSVDGTYPITIEKVIEAPFGGGSGGGVSPTSDNAFTANNSFDLKGGKSFKVYDSQSGFVMKDFRVFNTFDELVSSVPDSLGETYYQMGDLYLPFDKENETVNVMEDITMSSGLFLKNASVSNDTGNITALADIYRAFPFANAIFGGEANPNAVCLIYKGYGMVALSKSETGEIQRNQSIYLNSLSNIPTADGTVSTPDAVVSPFSITKTLNDPQFFLKLSDCPAPILMSRYNLNYYGAIVVGRYLYSAILDLEHPLYNMRQKIDVQFLLDVNSSKDGQFLSVENGVARWVNLNMEGLPSYSPSDNEKSLTVIGGRPRWTTTPRYEHTITIKNSAGKILWTQTMRNSSNTVVNSYANLKTLFGEATYAGYGEYAQLDLHGGTEATDKLIKLDGTEATLASLGAIVYQDDCFLPK